jgi:hypothetical protein
MDRLPLGAMLRRMSRRAEQIFTEDDMLPPTWLFERGDGEQIMMATPIELPEGDPAPAAYKQAVSDAMREFICNNGVVRYAFASEVWIGAPDNLGRKEGIYVGAEESSARLEGLRDIIRPQHGKPYLGRLELHDLNRPGLGARSRATRFMGLLLGSDGSMGVVH